MISVLPIAILVVPILTLLTAALTLTAVLKLVVVEVVLKVLGAQKALKVQQSQYVVVILVSPQLHLFEKILIETRRKFWNLVEKENFILIILVAVDVKV